MRRTQRNLHLCGGAPLLGPIPVDPAIARPCDEGDIERYDSEALWGFADALSQAAAVKVR